MKKLIFKFFDHLDLIVFSFLLFSVDVALRWRIGLDLSDQTYMMFDLSCILIVGAVLFVLPRRFRLFSEGLSLLVISCVAFAQRLHYAYFSIFYSFQKLALIKELGGVVDSIYGKIARRDGIFLIPLICFILFVLVLTLFKRVSSYKTKISLANFLFRVIVACSLFYCGVNLHKEQKNLFTATDNWNLDDNYNYTNLANKNRAVDRFGLFTYSYLDLKKVITVNFLNDNDEMIERINSEIDSISPDYHGNDYTGIFEGKNLILIQAESLANFALNEEYMPVLSRMASEGVSFTNHYAPVYQSATADTEFISQTSLIPSIDFGSTSYTFNQNVFPYSLANSFKNAGYTANSFHSYYRVFYNREVFHEALGFETFNDKDALGFQYPEEYLEGINWPSDVELMDRTVQWTVNKNTEPFYDFIITTTGHMPYVYYRLEYEGYYWSTYHTYGMSEEMSAYIATQRLFDYSLEVLMMQLEAAGMLDDTVIVVYGDHYPYGLSEQAIEENFGADYEKYQVPWVIWSKDGTLTGTIDDVVSTFDIMPTLSNLFGLEMNEDVYFTGVDYYSGEDSVVYFYDRSWLTDDFYYDSSTNEITILNDQKTESDAATIMDRVTKVFEISQELLKSNYFGG